MTATQTKQHAKQRAEERYGIVLSNSKRKQIARLIESGAANFLCRGGLVQRKVYGISFEGQRLRVVYDHYTRRIVTFLPNGEKK